ncbi:MAG TPA: 16S rRNA (guanine(527)-N(7))-methyltransferase RsmG [Prolixibacteraceae bacterium]|nr:16S rRNA (guanine(527)-N(7))-methyltransferase RsmG [Prolixibacteraceae bacterium]
MGTDLLSKYFPELTALQISRFGALEGLYREWNEKINVISRKDIDELYVRHVLHSLSIAKIIRFQPGTTLLDVGTGGGFPGIPLAILFPECHFTLIDSIGKKILVVQEIADRLHLTNVNARKNRVQEIRTKYDFVLSRAVTAFPDFVSMVSRNISPHSKNALPNGIIYLKGGDFESELSPFKASAEVFDLAGIFSEPFFETKKVIYLPVR